MRNLLMRDIVGLHGNAVVLGHMKRERTPSAPGLGNRLAGLKPELAAYVVHLGYLGRFQSGLWRRKISASVDQLGIQPQLVKIVSQIIMAMDVLLGAPFSVVLEPIHRFGHEALMPPD